MRTSKQRLLSIACLVALLSVCGALPSVQASTVLQMSFGEVVSKAELVFEGRVTGLKAGTIVDGSIHTYVTFQIKEVVKGAFTGESIELRFLGGQVGSRGLWVSDMQIPEMGETGIYFVETLGGFQVNPLVGWAQGHFLIEEVGNDDSIVTSASHDPILSVEADDEVDALAPPAFSKGIAKGVVVSSKGIASYASRGISPGEFKAGVRAIVEQNE